MRTPIACFRVLIALLGISGLLSSITAKASWNSEALGLARSFQHEPNLFPDSNISSLWGSARARAFEYFHPSYEVVSLPSPAFAAGTLDVLISLRKSYFRVRRSRLLVFLPGLFNNPEDAMSVRGLALYAERGYHVLVIPNPWSAHYVSRKPKFSPGNVQLEGRTVLEILASARKRIGADRIEGVDLVGDSYGAYTAAVAYAEDSQRPQPQIDGHATLIGSPVSLKKSILNLDRMVDGLKPVAVQLCQSKWSMARIMLDVFLSSSQDRLWPETRECAKTLLVHSGFAEELQTTTRALLAARELKEEHPEWLHDLSFELFIRKLTPENVDFLETGNHDLLHYWLARTKSERRDKIRIITAQDDFLNDPSDWVHHQKLFELTDRNFIILPWGGHLGYESLPWFQKFLDAAFKRN